VKTYELMGCSARRSKDEDEDEDEDEDDSRLPNCPIDYNSTITPRMDISVTSAQLPNPTLFRGGDGQPQAKIPTACKEW